MKYRGKGVLFLDIGGVLLSTGWGRETRKKAADEFGFDFDEMNERHALIFNLYETGKITLDEYLDIAVFNQPRSFSPDSVKNFMYAQSTEQPDMLPWLLDWKKETGVRIISIHNEGKELNSHRVSHFGLTRLFDAFVCSGDVGMCKPDPDLFRLALGVAHCAPESCIYFDDTLVHVEAARKAGIQGHHHTSFIGTKRILEEWARI